MDSLKILQKRLWLDFYKQRLTQRTFDENFVIYEIPLGFHQNQKPTFLCTTPSNKELDSCLSKTDSVSSKMSNGFNNEKNVRKFFQNFGKEYPRLLINLERGKFSEIDYFGILNKEIDFSEYARVIFPEEKLIEEVFKPNQILFFEIKTNFTYV